MPLTDVRIPTQDGTADGFAALPDGGGRHPGVLLYADAFGVRPVLRAMAARLAAHGYYVLVPHFFYRHGTAPLAELPEHIDQDTRPAVIGKLMPFVDAHTADRVLRDADAYLDFLTGRPEVAEGPVAAVGYCVGAVLAVRTAAAHPGKVAAVAGFHPGGLVTDAPDSPHRTLPGLTAEVHLGLAVGDMKPAAVEEWRRALDATGVDHTCEVYPGTQHGFTMADTSSFDQAAFERHWDRLLPLLDRNLNRG
ncbi:dienelactone hydrolase family protein [Streptomyces sp. NPDC050560]|uniref:dienelactone hydrolase family protein n=1 Tax=Streptomyces sp. NPDC050560 TaxID=3365630 RepID=UPI0037A5E989